MRDSVRHESVLIRFVLISNAVSTGKVIQIPVKARPSNEG